YRQLRRTRAYRNANARGLATRRDSCGDSDAPCGPARGSGCRSEFFLLGRGELHNASSAFGQRRNGMRRRVVVTGMGGITALGEDWPTIRTAFEAGKTAIRQMPEWNRYQTLNTRLGAPIDGFDVS